MKDYIIRAIDKNKSIRIFVSKTTNMADKARQIHNTSPTATAAMGRLITIAAIMGIMLKSQQDKITLQIQGDGPIGTMIAVADFNGNVKALVGSPNADLPPRIDGKFDVGSLVGKNGDVIVIKDYGLKKPYVGKSPLITGEIAEDIANYYAISEQQPSAVALGVFVGKDTVVKSAGGLIVQILPNIEEDELSRLENCLNKMNSISSLINKGMTPEEILENVFGDFCMEILERKEIELLCDCSEEKMKRALISIGEEELKDILNKEGKAELTCHFCNKKYMFNKVELQKLLQMVTK